MKLSISCVLLILVFLGPSVSPGQSIDLRVPFDRLMDQGAEAYLEGRYDEAATAYRDARLLRPQSPEVLLNLGLAEAKLGNLEAARDRFRESRQLLPAEDRRRAESWYNEGTSWLEEALLALQAEESAGAAPDKLLEAIDRFGEALQADPQHERARHNRLAAQNVLAQMQPPPPPQGEDENDDQQGDSEDEQNEDSPSQPQDQEQDPSDENQEGDSQSDQDQQDAEQDPTQDEPPDSEDQQPQESEPEESESEPDEGEPEEGESEDGESEEQEMPAAALPDRPEEMTPEEARELLNLLGNRDLMIFRQPRQSQTPPGGRDW